MSRYPFILSFERPHLIFAPVPVHLSSITMANSRQKYVVVGAGPVGSLAALYAAKRGYQVEIYELRSGE